mmetsp:Transcript_19002/g.31080  ORF Transcript_19002/g.31080 Transcript_19002/m.31080 type:complete len:275 (+) Transcript_19002:255-1079(+)
MGRTLDRPIVLLEMRTVQFMLLLFDSVPKLCKFCRNLLACLSEDVLKCSRQVLVVSSKERVCNPLCTSPSSSSNSMNIIFHSQRERYINHIFNTFNIKSTRRDVCSYKNWKFAFIKHSNGFLPRRLCLVSVNSCNLKVVPGQRILNPRSFLFVQSKYYNSIRPVMDLAQQLQESTFLGHWLQHFNVLRNRCRRREFITANNNLGRFVHKCVRKFTNCWWPCSGKHNCLAFFHWNCHRNNSFYILFESHIKHSIRFIENKVVDIAEVNNLVLNKI